METGKITGVQSFQVTKADGSIRQQWQENTVGKFLRTNLGVNARIFGHYADRVTHFNLITNAGLAGSASRINGSGGASAFTYLAVGTGTSSAIASDTTLEAEATDSGLSRVASTVSLETTTVTNDTAQLDTTFSVTGTKAITEAGALNASSSGTLLGRQVFSAINVSNGDSLQITYKFQMS